MDTEGICGLYALTHLNGKKAPASATLCLTKDGDAIATYVLVANVIKGKAKLEDGRLTGMLLSSMAAGDKNQMIVEDAITGGFGSGFDVRKDINRLLLKNENNALIFVETLKIDDVIGNHSLVTVDGEIPKKAYTIKVVRENNELIANANLGVPLRGSVQIIEGVLKGNLKCNAPDAEDYLVPLAKKFIAALQTGFQIKKNDVGLLLKNSDCPTQLRCVINKKELQGEYIFKSMNGAPIVTDRQLLLSFDDKDDFTVHASIANQLRGSASLDNNVLRADGFFASTRMQGNEDEMKVERALTVGMNDGFTLSLIGNQLTMKGEATFVLLKVAEVEATQSGPTFKGTHVVKCFKTEGNGLLFRIINEVDDQWALYNDTPDYRMHVHATFGSRSTIKALGNSKLERDDKDKYVVECTIEPGATEMFVVGKVNGFKMLYSAEPLDSW